MSRETPPDDRSDGVLSNAPPVPWATPDALAVLGLSLLALSGIGSYLRSIDAVGTGPAIPATALTLLGLTLGYVALRFRSALGRLFGAVRPALSDVGLSIGLALVALLGNAAVVWFLANLVRSRGAELPAVQQTFRNAATDPAALPWLAVSAILLSPLAEEIFFRGMLFQALRRRLDLWPSAGIAGLAFTAVHAQNTLLGTGMVFLVIFPFGLLLAWVFDRRGTLAVPVLTHALFNLAGILALQLGPAG